ncbi:MAG: helix-turn-helix transcriptional regulator, partial [Pseudomonadota bacterium]
MKREHHGQHQKPPCQIEALEQSHTSAKAKEQNRRAPSGIDVKLGQYLRLVRETKGISQQKLAEQAHLSPQQIQKYETGANRLSVNRLYQLATVLGMSVNVFLQNALQAPAAPFPVVSDKQIWLDRLNTAAHGLDVMCLKDVVRL